MITARELDVEQAAAAGPGVGQPGAEIHPRLRRRRGPVNEIDDTGQPGALGARHSDPGQGRPRGDARRDLLRAADATTGSTSTPPKRSSTSRAATRTPRRLRRHGRHSAVELLAQARRRPRVRRPAALHLRLFHAAEPGPDPPQRRRTASNGWRRSSPSIATPTSSPTATTTPTSSTATPARRTTPTARPTAARSRPSTARNYLRNSVKAVVDAYNGSVTFYVFAPDDPIIKAYRKMLPGLFRDRSDDARQSPPPHPLPGGSVHRPGRDVRHLPHDQPDHLLQPRGSLGGAARALSQQRDRGSALLRDGPAAGRAEPGIHADAAAVGGRQEPDGRMARRPIGRRQLRQAGRVPLSQGAVRRRSGAGRVADQFRQPVLGRPDLVGPARFAA